MNVWLKLFLILGAVPLQVSGGVFLPVNFAPPVVWLVVAWLAWETSAKEVLLWAFIGGLGLDLAGSGWVGVQALSLTLSWGLLGVLERSFLGRSRSSRMVNGLVSLGGYYLILWSLENILPTT